MTTSQQMLDRLMEKPGFKKVWDESAPQREFANGLVKMRSDANLTQSQMAEKTGLDKDLIIAFETALDWEGIDYTNAQVQKLYADACAPAAPATP